MSQLLPKPDLLGASRTYPINCSYCYRDISTNFRINCCVCKNFNLCGDCFSVGAVIDSHEPSHSYRVPQCLDYSVFAKDWTMNEELLLLEGLERKGMGNWKNVADYIGTGKTHKQIEEHYFELYMGVHGYCLPSKTITADGAVDTLSLCPNSGAVDTFDGSSSTAGADRVNGANPFNVDVNSDLSDYYRINTNEGYHPGELVQRDIGKDTSTIKGKDNRAEYQSRLSALPGSDLPGYIPLRGDFDIEYDNNAEHLLADMEFNVDDHPSEKSLKLQIVEIFNQKLAERDERKRFVIERGLVDIRQTQAMEKRRSKDERELLGKLKMFARFCTPAEYEALVDGMIKAKKLKQQIEILKLYRQMGIRSLEQARQFEIDRKKREMEPRLKKLPLMIPPDKSLSYRQAQAGVDMTEFWGGSSGRRAARSSSLPNNSNSDEDNTRKRRARLGLESCGSSSDEERSSEKRSRKASKTSERDSSAIKDVNQAEELKKLEERKVIVENAPNAQLLSPMEIDLCATVPMLPSHYLMAKEAIVREAYRCGMLTLDGVRRVVRVAPEQSQLIYDFFVKELIVTTDKKQKK